MKNFFYLAACLLVVWSTTSCRKNTEEVLPAESYLRTVSEFRYMPDDSVTVNYQYDRDGVLVLESSPGFSIKGFKDSPETSKITQGWVFFRLYAFNPFNQLVKFTEFSPSAGPRSKSKSDSAIYEGGRLAKKVINRYSFNADGNVNFRFPLWTIRRTFSYDSKSQMVGELDSVFITHDIPAESTMIIQSKPKFVYTNEVTNNYSDKGELMQVNTVSHQDKFLTYSNGTSAYSGSYPGRIYEGVVKFGYEYNAEGKVSVKTSNFIDKASDRSYTSRFVYGYDKVNP